MESKTCPDCGSKVVKFQRSTDAYELYRCGECSKLFAVDVKDLKPIPTIVAETPVEVVGDPLVRSNGEHWITLISTNLHDERVWEFDRTSGRIIRTRS